MIPVFPLSLVLFPGESLNLHIFEPRYKQLILESQKEGFDFGIPAHIDSKQLRYGTMASLERIVKTYPDGRMDIKTKGLDVFKIEQYHKSFNDKLYPGADVSYIKGNVTSDPVAVTIMTKMMEQLYEFMKIKKDIPKPTEHNFSFAIGHHIGLSINQEAELLAIENETDREAFIIDHLEHLLPIITEMEELRKKVQMNGHFKNVIPPEI